MNTILSKKKNEIGHICSECGREHLWPPYVFAHMHHIITHSCECGIKSEIHEGVVNKIENNKEENLNGNKNK